MKVNIKKLAKAKGWTLYRLAKEMDLNEQTVYSWGAKSTQPGYANMERLCEVLGCTIGELFECEPVSLLEK